MDYKDTLFLPQTQFEMRANLPANEPKFLQFWADIDLFQTLRLRAKTSPREKFILHDGPPYANGHLHIGHALNKILKDLVSRTRQMLGYDAIYVPGWDCHGLPIEWKIEEEYRAQGKNKDEVEINEFRAQCRDYAHKWLDIQRNEFKRLGVHGDWDNPYTTMNFKAEGIIAKEILKFLMNGGLYRGSKPVLWSIVEKTALAEAEVEYKDVSSTCIYTAFTISNGPLQGKDIVIWTTTPWTIPGNRAVAFGAEVEYSIYSIIEMGEGKAPIGRECIIADKLVGEFCQNTKIASLNRIRPIQNSELHGLILHHPLRELHEYYNFAVPLLMGEFVTDSAGTGFVHCAPGHGEDDYHLGLKHNIAIPHTVREDGGYYPQIGLMEEAMILDKDGKEANANGVVIKNLVLADKLYGKHRIKHSYPHSWRSKAPLIFRNTPQWFISMDTNELRQKALNAINNTEFFPLSGKTRLYDMISNRPDWCISRQRSWGVPLPLFVHKKTGALLRDPAVNERIIADFMANGADVWFTQPASQYLGSDYNSDDYEQIRDVVDVWFDSGSTHAFVLEERPDMRWPADIYLEGSDQHRGWFHSSLLVGCGTRGRAPYNQLLTHGFVLDEQGRKMSKSLGNITTPQQVIDQYGADILRLWVIASDYSLDLGIGPNALKQIAESYRKIRNTLRWVLGMVEPLTSNIALDDMPILEQYIHHRLFTLDREMRKACMEYDFHGAYKIILEFCDKDLSSFYCDIRKDSLYCDPKHSAMRLAAHQTLHQIFAFLNGWCAPFLCFTAEESYQEYKRKTGLSGEISVHCLDFETAPSHWQNDVLAQKMAKIAKIRKDGLLVLEAARKEKTIGSSLEAMLTLTLNDGDLADISPDDWAKIFIVSQVDIKTGDYAISMAPANGEKCERCWNFVPKLHDNICPRCTGAIH